MKTRNLSLQNISVIIFVIASFTLYGQNSEIEWLRNKAYQSRISENLDSSIFYYSKITEKVKFDYDAILALAKLYYLKEDYEKSSEYFTKIYNTDNTDAEALFGIGKILIIKEDYVKAGYFYDRALKPEKPYIPFYLDRARTLIYQDKLDSAVAIYQLILRLDNSVAEAWAGIGKMNYWQNKPVTALSYYKKALEFDPENKEYRKIFDNLRQETAFKVNYSLRSIMEEEESYRIDAILNSFGVTKRIANTFQLGANFLIDHAQKDNLWISDSLRLFSNLRLNAIVLGKKNRLNLFAGYSFSDKVFSSYGAYYTALFKIKSLKIYITPALGYDYFYYWNKVGQFFASDNLTVLWKKVTLSADVKYGVVSKNVIEDYEYLKFDHDQNPYLAFSTSLKYKLLAKPVLSLGLNYSLLDFKYNSPLYYTPKDRNLIGFNANFYYEKGNFFIDLNGAYNLGQEIHFEKSVTIPGEIDQNTIPVNNINWETGIGYNAKRIGISTGYSGFINPYYKNRVIFVSLNGIL